MAVEKNKNLRQLKHLPPDLFFDHILPVLPAKSLIRFMSVCKTWRTHIRSPQFIAAHLSLNRRSGAKGERLLLLEMNLRLILDEEKMDSCRILDKETLIESERFDFPRHGNRFRYFQYCIGLFFLEVEVSGDEPYVMSQYMVWNPAIRKFKIFETIKSNQFYYDDNDLTLFGYVLHGMGFHESSNDHRIIRIKYVIDDMKTVEMSSNLADNIPIEVDVYSLREDSWHRVVDSKSNPLRLIAFNWCDFYLNRAIHWFATTRYTRVLYTLDGFDYRVSILVFDFTIKCFVEMKLPVDMRVAESSLLGFVEYEGSLAFLIDNYGREYVDQDDVVANQYHFWVMAEYGVPES